MQTNEVKTKRVHNLIIVDESGSIGIFQGDRLFYTFESAECPLDIEALNAFIESNFR